jgi:hypothetical protein
MATFDLVFDSAAFPVPKKSVFELFDHHRVVIDATSYAVQSSVPLEVFETFVGSLKTQDTISVTNANAAPLLLLAKEFFISELAAECGAFSVSTDQFLRLTDRVCELERQISCFSNRSSGKIDDQIESQERELESLRLRLEKLQALVEEGLKQLKSDLEQLQPKSELSPSGEPAKSQSKVEIPMKEVLLDGIISYLTKKHGGNVQEVGIVTISSKSVQSDGPELALKNVANLASGSCFKSKKEPGQWVCWDFREMRVRPTRYTIRSWFLKSWVVEGSLDGSSWTEMDRQTDNLDFDDDLGWKGKKWTPASFAVSKPAEFRVIRLTQTDEDHDGMDVLSLRAIEFFGTLSE